MKLISLNIQEDFHLDKVSDFLKSENAEVVCLQEVFEDKVFYFANILGMQSVFAPKCTKWRDGGNGFTNRPFGNAILSKYPITSSEVYYYYGSADDIAEYRESPNPETEIEPMAYPVIVANIKNEDKDYVISTTHLPVTFQGQDREYQTECARKLVEYLKKFPELVLALDLNAPRGGETFSIFSEVYKDNIPLEYKTSLDPKLHRVSPEILDKAAKAMGLEGYMIDGLFSTPNYKATNVKLVDGVSDHMAVVAELDKI